MSTGIRILIIGALAAAVVILVGFGVVWLRGRIDATGRRRAAERPDADAAHRIDTKALFFGLRSRGRAQLRGTGVLVLAPGELWFSRYVRREDHAIALSRIREVSLVGSHLGKKIIGRKLLHVRFAGDSGEDSIAWLVADAAGWQRDIEQRLDTTHSTPATEPAAEDTHAPRATCACWPSSASGSRTSASA